MTVATCPTREELEAFALKRGDRDWRFRVVEHLNCCPDCARVVETLIASPTQPNALSPAPEPARSDDHTRIDPHPEIDATHVQVGAPGTPVTALRVRADASWLAEILAPPRSPNTIGSLGEYDVLELLGRGGMGAVLLAEDTRLERRVALKILLPEVAAMPGMKERFLREARLAAKLEHDHVVTIFRVGEERGTPYMAMPLLQGCTLDDWMRKKRRVPVPDILRIARQIASGLAAAHARGLIHRDIKPSNVWLDSTAGGRVKILDFGLACTAATHRDDRRLTETGVVMGTPWYMAPEQARGKEVDHRADLFSFGCVVYHLCTGRVPFDGPDALSVLTALAVDTPEPPDRLNPEVPKPLADLTMKLLNKRPEDRFRGADEVARVLLDIERSRSGPPDATVVCPAENPWAGIDGDPVPPIKPAEGKPPRSVMRFVWAAALGSLALLLAGIVFFMPGKDAKLRVEIDDPEIEVGVVGTGIVLRKADRDRDVSLEPGEKTLRLSRGEFRFETDKLVLKKGERTAVRVELIAGKGRVFRDGNLVAEKAIPKPIVAKPKESPKESPSVPGERARGLARQLFERVAAMHVRTLGGEGFYVKSAAELPKADFRIEWCSFSGPPAEQRGDALFDGLDLDSLTSLTSVTLGSATLTDAGLAKFARLPGAERITLLSLETCPKLTDAAVDSIAGMKGLTQVVLCFVPISDAGLARLARHETLGTVALRGVPVTGTGFADFRDNLKTVVLLGQKITPEAATAISKLPGLDQLNLDGSPLTVAHLRALAGSRLNNLNLSDTGVTRDGLETLTALPELRHLSLRSCHLVDADLEPLRKLDRLETLYVRQNPALKEETLRDFARVRPGRKIESDFGAIVVEPTPK